MIYQVHELSHCLSDKIHIIHSLPLCEGNKTICSPEAGNIARGRIQRHIILIQGQQLFYYAELPHAQ